MKKHIKIKLSTAPNFKKGMVCRCNTCGSVFAIQPDTDYCPFCKYYDLDKNYEQKFI